MGFNSMKATVVKKSGGLFPVAPSDIDKLNKYANGEIIEVSHRKARFYPLLQKYWALCNMIAQNAKAHSDFDCLNTRELVSEYIKLKVGHIDSRIVIRDHVHIITKSISYSAMDQDEFSEFFNKAVDVMSALSGIPVPDLLLNWAEYECGVQ